MIYNEDCIEGARKYFKNESVDLIVCDPPFGINESQFHKHYARNETNVLDGYVEAPHDYQNFTDQWVGEAARILKPNGSFYIISGWNHLKEVLIACDNNKLETINHIIWKYNFGVATKKKFVSSHYHILYLKKSGGTPQFNTNCRFGPQHKLLDGRSALYSDMEDVWTINKEYQPGEHKNKNKLPESLLEKIILYSSNEGDVVCDFFLGSFTTAISSLKLGRTPRGFEINKESFDFFMPILDTIEVGSRLREIGNVEVDNPSNQGKPLSDDEKKSIITEYQNIIAQGSTKKRAIEQLCQSYGRGKFSITNIIKEQIFNKAN